VLIVLQWFIDMDNRKELILNTIIKEYIETGTPVGSGFLVEKYELNISPATVRNEMAELEEVGLIAHPHTSAGRIPTELAYNLYIENLQDKKLGKVEAEKLKKSLVGNSGKEFKQTAKDLAQISNNAVFWAFHKNNLYYTGISNMLQQTEFNQMNSVHSFSSVIDHVDEAIDEIFDGINFGTHTMVGSKNPFGNFCGTVLAKYKHRNNIGLFGILGPIRMDYEKNISLINFIISQIENNK